MKFGLKEDTIHKIQKVFSAFPEVDEAVLYGSRAKGNYKNGSDIDLTFMGNSISDTEWTTIHFDLDDLLTPYSFDLSLFSTIDNPDLIDHINRVGKTFYERGK